RLLPATPPPPAISTLSLHDALPICAAVQESDLVATYERQERIGYRSELIVGEREVDEHMKALFPDWRARGVTVCLHERQGGFARSEEHTSELQSRGHLVCRLLLEKK